MNRYSSFLNTIEVIEHIVMNPKVKSIKAHQVDE